MQTDQVPQEQQSQQVEETGDAKEHLELFEEDALVHGDVTLLELLCFLGEVIHDYHVGDVVHQTHQEDKHYQDEKVPVILLANAVIQPSAVVVEAFDASVASATMLGTLGNVGLTDFTFELVSTLVKFLATGVKK